MLWCVVFLGKRSIYQRSGGNQTDELWRSEITRGWYTGDGLSPFVP